MMSYDLVLFDLDGTLIASAPEICDAVNDTLHRFDLPLVAQLQVNDWIGHGTGELLIQAVASASKTPVAVVRESSSLNLIATEFQKYYQRRCGTRSQVYPQVREALSTLHSRGVALALLTNKEQRFTDTVLDAHQLTGLFDKIVCGDTLASKKPNPAGIESCLKHFAVSAAQALMVGDSSIDIATARNAGIAVWALPYGYNMGRPIAESQPDRLIKDCGELLSIWPSTPIRPSIFHLQETQ